MSEFSERMVAKWRRAKRWWWAAFLLPWCGALLIASLGSWWPGLLFLLGVACWLVWDHQVVLILRACEAEVKRIVESGGRL